MKKFFYSAFAIMTVVSLTVLIFKGIQAESVKSSEISTATVNEKKGECEFKEFGKTKWSTVELNAKYAMDTTLKTGSHSFMQVAFDEFNSFRMKSNTEVIINAMEEKSKEKGGNVIKIIKLDILDGEIGVKLEKLPKDSIMKVSGPTAVAGASGTGFSVLANKVKSATRVAVFDSSVVVEAFDKPNKSVRLAEFQESTAAPWKDSIITGRGIGYLSRRQLGDEFVDKFKQPAEEIKIEAKGKAEAPENINDKDERRKTSEQKAIESARAELAKLVLPMSIGQDKTVADILKESPEKSKQVYEAISNAEISNLVFTNDDIATVTASIKLSDLSKALDSDIEVVLATIKEITRDEYLDKFGAKAYETTFTAAKVAAQRNLAERLYGSVISIGNTLRDEAGKDNQITVKIQGFVRDAKVSLIRYFDDGSIEVILEAPGEQVQTDLGRGLVGDTWLTSPETVQVDDFEMMKELVK